MDSTTDFFGAIARQQAEERALALQARQSLRKLQTFPPSELTKMFLAICHAGEKYDVHHACRRQILKLLPDVNLIDLIGLQMPVALAKAIEKRLTPKAGLDSDDDTTWPRFGFFLS